MRNLTAFTLLLLLISVSLVQAAVYTGVVDNRAGQQFIPGMTAQSQAWISGGDPGVGVRLEWQADNVTAPGSWTYTYRLLRGPSKSKGFAFFDIETANDFTSANILSKQVTWAVTRNGSQLLSGLAGVTISDPVNFNAVHDFSNAAVTEPRRTGTSPLNKGELSHYSGDPGIAPPGQPGLDASATPSVGPVPHPFYGVRVTFPGAAIAYEAVEWEFKIVTDRPPMWGSFFGWGDQTVVSPFWYSNMYNNNIDNPVRLTLPPASCNFGESPYQGWILVPGHPTPPVTDQASFLTVERASYSRDASGAGQINMAATSLQNVNIRLTVNGSGFASPVVMTPDTTTPFPGSKHLATIPFSSLPASVLLDNSLDPAAVLPYPIRLVDEVSISQAVFDPLTRTMTIKAASQDRMAPLPTLTAVDFAAPNQFDPTGTFTATLAVNPPATVTVISSRGGAATAVVSISTQQTPPVSAVTVVADKTSPHVTGTPVTFSAVGSGGSGSYEFRYYLFNGTLWSLVQDYSSTATWTLPGTTAAGTYTVAVDIRNAGSTVDRDTVTYLEYQVVAQPAPATGVTVFTDKATPHNAGTPVTFAAVGSGGSGSYEFRYYLFNGTLWSLVQDYSPTATWTLPGATGAGTYTVAVDIRNAGSTVFRDAVVYVPYVIQ